MAKVSVVIGRFQTPSLHEGHLELLRLARAEADGGMVVVLVGTTENLGSKRNPLDYATRESVLRACPNVDLVLPIMDAPTDEEWSENVDRLLVSTVPNGQFTLIGGRDSFLPHYTGMFATKQVATDWVACATEIREQIAKKPVDSEDFRKGVIYSAYNQWPRVFQTVDVALCVRKSADEYVVYLGKRKGEDRFRFFGGFVDVGDTSLEMAAVREAKEEANLPDTVYPCDMVYLGSHHMADYRYPESSGDATISSFFCAEITQEIADMLDAGDDIDSVEQFTLQRDGYYLCGKVVPEHAYFANHLYDYLFFKKKE